ncbi:sugar ABC transporter permease [Antrihabitans sp. YC2-6]|nr:sugar ABC transporter permease [Antrihabitans sp. YC2-6]
MQSRRRSKDFVAALPWIAPVVLLIGAIVVFPVGFLFWTSTRDLNRYGKDQGSAGFDNFSNLADTRGLALVLTNTVIWVVAVVGITLVLSMALAQFLNKDFPGRKLVRLAVLVPWAASVVMTTTIFYYMLGEFGLVNQLLLDLGLIDEGFTFIGEPRAAFVLAIVVGVFVSIPFTAYTILAGLQSIPGEVIEASRVDGANAWQRYRFVVLPQLRPAIAVATIVNIINVFNSLPILQVLTGGIAGYKADTTTTLTFKFIRVDGKIDTAAALSVVNFALILGVIAIYVIAVKPLRAVDR